ncbi:hypothetical protein TPHA_0J00490 [Tetrapisispora phaffii CBS 4417]|uniref:Transcription initiation factor TFIID subunit 4 n=1 Tax=Tetrapisispora phaffii (strain ATCC 24235 / CBS 4417 / NBRC 1672 / NRRL Y-8282 / UCD 70-5) TaxID=1071381 RepID=G8BYD0_TETPH|nr:hypothetical protein TPHA_0J00490 [Tetrapisispora phaffii CBS 4417]CCE64872.1 hypothetical protein TPHA_0J00490 [Tetrapisispora phaffii CBS 4417]
MPSPENTSEPLSNKLKPNSQNVETDPTFNLRDNPGISFVDNAAMNSSLNTPVGFASETPTSFDNEVGNDETGSSTSGIMNNDNIDANIYNTPLPASQEPTINLNKDSATVNSKETQVSMKTEPAEAEPDSIPNSNNKNISSVRKPAIGAVGSGLALPQLNQDSKKNAKKSNASNSKAEGSKANQPADANKMSDVLFSAGVDIREEEALLNSSVNTSKNQTHATIVNMPEHPPFLHPSQVSKFMKKIAREQTFNQDFTKNNDILAMISTACETYMKDLITNTIVVSRHRRRAVQLNSGRRSKVSVELRNIAINQKKDEERRVKKRIALGLEKEDTENKIDSEETLHRASNATAGLRAGTKKQYGWLTSSVNKPLASNAKTTGKIAAAVQARGDIGLKFREAREEPGIVMRDLLFALENRRIGTSNVITKGYSRIRD